MQPASQQKMFDKTISTTYHISVFPYRNTTISYQP